jgi:hypothetical protein
MRRGMFVASALLASTAACIIAKRSLEMPPNDQTTVALFSGTLGEPMNGIARHPWFAVRHKGETEWKVYEVGGGGTISDASQNSPYGDPILHGIWRGEEGERAAACVEDFGPRVKEHIEKHYIFYPGPNSNTFGDVVLRGCKLSASLPSTSVGNVIGLSVGIDFWPPAIIVPVGPGRIGFADR